MEAVDDQNLVHAQRLVDNNKHDLWPQVNHVKLLINNGIEDEESDSNNRLKRGLQPEKYNPALEYGSGDGENDDEDDHELKKVLKGCNKYYNLFSINFKEIPIANLFE